MDENAANRTRTDQERTDRARADQLLVVRCQLGERAAFDDLIRRWSGSLHRYALKLSNDPELADDLTQDVWLRALQGLGTLREAAQFRAWLFGIAHRTFMDRLRTRYAMPVDTCVDMDELAAADSGDDEDLQRSLATGMASLPIVEREVLTLFYLEELSLADIAAALGIPVGTVKSRLFRARALLRKHIAPEESRT
ncbi:RNA polymerase sigma factor [Lysobacter capsici]|uniref:RNA polymerase sigma factor n=1 Tax=Lysobacter capsici TaxID=435897 RepID=UPI00287B76A6|nr:sigma-70 family RNA polymerase sigma factor [Lysobacter capsici]WND79979.1 sigma-70 family RNA polymerase sigma factor [Lysobacter capsici]WND85175.1 sigma-70 family RNA polymerase sigma factor [Lysobacter capsici]